MGGVSVVWCGGWVGKIVVLRPSASATAEGENVHKTFNKRSGSEMS
jgi:hypothetical protein